MILIRAAVQICSHDFGLAGWILADTAGYCIHLARSGTYRNGGLTFSGVQRLFLRIPASDQKQVAPENIAQ